MKTPVPQFLLYQKPATLSKKRPWYRYFPVNFAKFLGISLLNRTLAVVASEWLSNVLIFAMC